MKIDTAKAPRSGQSDVVGRDLVSSSGSGAGRRRIFELVGPRNIGAVYVLIVLCVGFSIDLPGTFANLATVKQVLNASAITALASLAIIVPLSARTFDLSFGYTMSLSGVVSARFLIEGHGLALSILAAMGAAVLVGAVNGIVVVGMRIDSFIGTLGTGALVQAFTLYLTRGAVLNGKQLGGGFSKIYSTQIFGLTAPVWYAFGLAILLWIVLDHTPTGRRFYAIGFNPDAAKLANIGVARLRVSSLMISAVIAGFAGIVVASSTQAGDGQSGTPYLLLAFSTAFLGATQFKGGRFNAWGTLVAVVMLEVAIVGLGLAGAPVWAGSAFTGVMLITALSATGLQRRARRGNIGRWKRYSRRLGRTETPRRPETS